MDEPLIIEVAINGAVSKQRNPHVPQSTDEVVASIEACLAAGATVVHAHAGDPVVGKGKRHASEPYAAAFGAVLERHPDALLYPTLPGGGPHTDIAQRYAHIAELAAAGMLRMTPIDPGTMNYGRLEPDGTPPAHDTLYQNSFADVAWVFEYCNQHQLGCTMSIFEPGFLQLVLAHASTGTLPRGSIVKFEFSKGARPFGLPPTALSLDAYVAMLKGTDIPWMVNLRDGDISAGFAALAIERGGHVRVGIEDYGGPRQPRNEALVAEIAAQAGKLGRRIATPTEAAALMRLPGLQRRHR